MRWVLTPLAAVGWLTASAASAAATPIPDIEERAGQVADLFRGQGDAAALFAPLFLRSEEHTS